MSDQPDTAEIELARAELNTYSALAAIANTEGGQVLMKSLASDAMNAIDTLSAQAGVMSEQTLRAMGMKIATTLHMYRALANADSNRRGAQEELDALLNS
jgi:hypothetical protein